MSTRLNEKAKTEEESKPLVDFKNLEEEAKHTLETITSKFNKVNNDLLDLISNKIYRADSTPTFFVLICWLCSVASVIEITCNGMILAISIFIFSVLLMELNKIYPMTNLVSVFAWGLIFLIGVIAIAYLFVFTFGLGFILAPFFCFLQFIYCFYLTYLYKGVLDSQPHIEQNDKPKSN